jgi:hypothetical protein
LAACGKTRSRKYRDDDGSRKSKADAHNEIAHTAESALPPKKPLAPSVKRRRAKVRKLK